MTETYYTVVTTSPLNGKPQYLRGLLAPLPTGAWVTGAERADRFVTQEQAIATLHGVSFSLPKRERIIVVKHTISKEVVHTTTVS